MNEQHALRQHLKRTRLELSARAQAEAAIAATARVTQQPRFLHAKRIAGYFGSKGELNPMPLLEQAAALNKQCYLPVLHPFFSGRLWFCRWQPGDRLVRNRFGIPEPVFHANKQITARNLDLVIVPLLGFDSECHRIGMGGGYYDRSFAFTRRLKHISKPFLLGFAHESQRVEKLHPQPWDITLDAIVTEQNLFCRSDKQRF
jgi:5-formyltetrahydrofolate cyclo-ligase